MIVTVGPRRAAGTADVVVDVPGLPDGFAAALRAVRTGLRLLEEGRVDPAAALIGTLWVLRECSGIRGRARKGALKVLLHP